MKLLDAFLYLLAPALVLLHLAVAPYTKVEESFNMQAVHDILVYGTPLGAGAAARLAHYDHFAFPGAVPRTFVGAVVLAAFAQPVVLALDSLANMTAANDNGPAAQLVVRGVLGLANAAALVVLARSLAAACGRPAGRWFLALQLSQFHVLFYASRTLPNMFAFFLTTLAFAFAISPSGGRPGRALGRLCIAIGLFVFAGVVFRAEVALLVAVFSAFLVVAPLAPAERVVRAGAVAAVGALLLSVPIDWYFWGGQWLWPELHGFLFNVLHGQASAWGVSPWHYYATSALPRLLLNPFVLAVLVPLALARPATCGPARLLVLPCLAFVAVYSLQPHKEARFILYVVPPLTAAAALGADQLQKIACKAKEDAKDSKDSKDAKEPKKSNNSSSLIAKILFAALILSIPLSFVASTAMLFVSALNYPGGEALAALRTLAHVDAAALVSQTNANANANATIITAHADVLSCMTGVTLFGSSLGPALPADPYQSAPGTVQLAVDKTEDSDTLLDPAFWAQFDYVLVEPQADDDNDDNNIKYRFEARQWQPVALVQGFAGVEVLRPGQADRVDGAQKEQAPVIGHGATVARLRQFVRGLTGGWWVGPRMATRIQILRQTRKDMTSRVEAQRI